MSEQIDWSKAPKWATHALEKLHEPDRNLVYWSFFVDGEHRVEPNGLWYHPDGYRIIQSRPTTPSWSGEGLPPVGVKVLIMNPEKFAITDYGQEFVGEECTVRAVFVNDLDYRMVAVEKVGGACCCFISEVCFPIRTPEQIAADEREKMVNMLWQRYLQPILAPAKEAQVKAALSLIYDDFYRKP